MRPAYLVLGDCLSSLGLEVHLSGRIAISLLMKKDKYYNTYFPGNLAESAAHVAWVQTIEKQGLEDHIIRIVDKSILSTTVNDPSFVVNDKDFLAYDPSTM